MPLDYDFRQVADSKRYIRKPKNQFDKTTIVSIFPKNIIVNYVTIEPGTYIIPAGSTKTPSFTVIGSASWWNDQGPNRPKLEITVSSPDLATAIIRDNCGSLLAARAGDRMPGVFFLPGEVNYVKLIAEYNDHLEKAEAMQKNWYEELTRVADIDWARHQGNPLVIHDDSRIAANELGRKDKPWMGQFVAIEMIPCVACGAARNPKFPICSNCHMIVDKTLANSLAITKAG